MAKSKSEKRRVDVHICNLLRCDMPEVLDINRQIFENPWSKDDFTKLRHQYNCIGMATKMGSKIVGFMFYELYKSKFRIANLAVLPSMRRKTIGSQMVEKTITHLSGSGRYIIDVQVRERNLSAHLFFKKQGFIYIKTLPSFYEDSGEDAYLMERRINGKEKPANRIAWYCDE